MELIWQRHIDPADQRARWRRVGRWFPLPAIAVIAVATISEGTDGALGALIIVGLVGVLVVGYTVAKGLTLKLAAPIQRDGDAIVSGTARLQIDQMTQWTSYILKRGERERRRASRGAGGMNVDIGILRFHMADGREVTMTWPELTQAEIDELRDALAPHLTAPWVARPEPHR